MKNFITYLHKPIKNYIIRNIRKNSKISKFLVYFNLDSLPSKIFYKFRKNENSIIVDGVLYTMGRNNKSDIINYITQRFFFYIKDQSKVLDVSCGSGAYLKALYDNNNDLILEGWDISKDAINNYALPTLPDAKFFLVDLEKLRTKYRNLLGNRIDHYDFIYCVTTIQYFSTKKIQNIFNQISQMITPRGYFALVFPFCTEETKHYGFTGFRYYTVFEVEALGTNAGLNCIYREDISHVFTTHYLLIFLKENISLIPE